MLRLTLLLITILFASVFMVLGANAEELEVGESCTENSECESDYCVQLKNENRKVCLYCSQSSYNTYWSQVESSCKEYPKGTFDSKQFAREFKKKNENKRKEWALPNLVGQKELSKKCLKARVERDEKYCWKDKMDDGHKKQIAEFKKLVRYIDGVINDSKRNGKAYSVDLDKFEELLDAEEDECEDFEGDFDKVSDIEKEDQVDCRELESVIDKMIDCKEARKDIVDVFKHGDPLDRKNEYNEAVAAQKETEALLEQKRESGLCK